MQEIQRTESTQIELTSFKRFYGYVLSVSREKLDKHREINRISHDDFIEILIKFEDEDRTIKMSYREFRDRLLS